jgi:hypothetical protein
VLVLVVVRAAPSSPLLLLLPVLLLLLLLLLLLSALSILLPLGSGGKRSLSLMFTCSTAGVCRTQRQLQGEIQPNGGQQLKNITM